MVAPNVIYGNTQVINGVTTWVFYVPVQGPFANGIYSNTFISGPIQWAGFGDYLYGNNNFILGLALPNPTGTDLPGLLLGSGANGTQQNACIIQDTVVAGNNANWLFISAGETAANSFDQGGGLVFYGGAASYGNGGGLTIQGGTNIGPNQAGSITITGGVSTNGGAGDIYITGGLGGARGGNVKILASNVGGVPGQVEIGTNSFINYLFTENQFYANANVVVTDNVTVQGNITQSGAFTGNIPTGTANAIIVGGICVAFK